MVGKIAMGGMAEILLARLVGPLGFEKPVVIKRILPALASSARFVEMFLEEARVVAEIRHPNVVQVHELGKDGGDLFMVMEYLEGESVAGILRRLWSNGKRMSPAAAALIAAEACAGLHAAHEATDAAGRQLRLVHRDVSPSNLFVTYDGHVKLLDFGVVKVDGSVSHTETGVVKGKSPYMSPEQALALTLDRRSDIFSLGIVLFEMCTLRRLFQRDSPLLVYKAVCEDPIPSLAQHDKSLPPELDRIAGRALARTPDDRYATARALRAELLTAAHALTRAEPEEFLSAMMRELFAERMEAKRRVRAQLEQSSVLTHIPEAETDLGARIPSVAEPAGEGRKPERRRSWRWSLGVAVGVAVGAGSTIAIIETHAEQPAPRTARPAATASAPIASSPPAPRVETPAGSATETRAQSEAAPHAKPKLRARAKPRPSAAAQKATEPVSPAEHSSRLDFRRFDEDPSVQN